MDRVGRWWKPFMAVLIILLILRGGACGACAGAGRPPPDERLAAHFAKLCKVAEHGIRDPKSGVVKMMRYYGDHGPQMLEDLGATLVMIERIDDDAAHDRRARQAHKRLSAPLIACEETFEQFDHAVANDPEASAILERGFVRLGRTLQILIGEEPEHDFVFAPRSMLRRLAPLAD
jgi:hypothetical protein